MLESQARHTSFGVILTGWQLGIRPLLVNGVSPGKHWTTFIFTQGSPGKSPKRCRTHELAKEKGSPIEELTDYEDERDQLITQLEN